MIRHIAALVPLALIAAPAHAQGAWPDDPWTDTRLVQANAADIAYQGRAVALSGEFLYSTGMRPGVPGVSPPVGRIAAFGITPSGLRLLSFIEDPAPQPSIGFGYPMLADAQRVFVANAGYTDPTEHPTFYAGNTPTRPTGPARVEVFRRLPDGALSHEQTLEDPLGQDGSGFGASIARSFDYLVVSAPFATVFGVPNAGAVFVYSFNSVQQRFVLRTTLTAPTLAQDGYFGYAVALTDRSVIVGWPGFANRSGRVVVYDNPLTIPEWKLTQIISPQDGPPEIGNLKRLGTSLATSLEGLTLAVGAPRSERPEGGLHDVVLVFDRGFELDDDFLFQSHLTPPADFTGLHFGRSIAIPSNFIQRTLIVGAGDRAIGGGIMNIYSSQWPDTQWSRDATVRFVNAGSLAARQIDNSFQFVASGNQRDRAILATRDALCFRDLRGDANNDGMTDFTDLSLVLSSFGQSGDDLPGDLNNDGVVDFFDINFVLFTFASPCLPPN